MNIRTIAGPVLLLVAVCGGCATRSSDPRQGGLFGYNPAAYEQRLRDRQHRLEQVEQENRSMETTGTGLEAERATTRQELARLKKELAVLASDTALLKKRVSAVRTTTRAQKEEQERILKGLAGLQAETRATDDVADPEEQRLELERLQKKRDRLLKEANDLMQL